VFLKLWSATVRRRFRQKNILPDTERRKNTTINIWAETAFLGWLSAGSRWISSLHKLLTFIHYFRKYFKLVYWKDVVMVTLTTTIMFLPFTCMQFWVLGILRRWSSCVLTANEVVCDWLKFEKHCARWKTSNYELLYGSRTHGLIPFIQPTTDNPQPVPDTSHYWASQCPI
jgi:hypothetical protein